MFRLNASSTFFGWGIGTYGLGQEAVSPPERGITPLRVPTVTCKSLMRPEGAEAGYRACVLAWWRCSCRHLGYWQRKPLCQLPLCDGLAERASPVSNGFAPYPIGKNHIAGTALGTGCHDGGGTLVVKGM